MSRRTGTSRVVLSQIPERTLYLMRLTPPSFLLFLASLACAVLALLPVLGVAVVTLPLSGFWLMALAWGLLAAGVLFRGL